MSSVQSGLAGKAQGGGLTMSATAGQPSPIGGGNASGIALGSGFEFTLGSDVTPPTIQHTPVLSQNVGQALPISATITDIGGVAKCNIVLPKRWRSYLQQLSDVS